MDSDTGQDITTPDQRKAYESGLMRMREAMIPIALAPLTTLLAACDKALEINPRNPMAQRALEGLKNQ